MNPLVPDSFPPDSEFFRSNSALPVRPRRCATPIFGAARLANRTDLEPFLNPALQEKHLTHLRGVGLILEQPGARVPLTAEFDCTLCFSEEFRNRHMLFVARPGGGKTTRGILPILLSDIADKERTVVSFETKGNHHALIGHWTKKYRRAKPVVLNLSDPTRSVGWNPVRRGLTQTEAHDIAYALCTAAERHNSSHDSLFWQNNAVKVTTGVLLAIARDPEETPCLARVREILEMSREALMAWSERNKDIAQVGFFRSFLSSGSHNAETCLADMCGRLTAFLDLNLCATTSVAEFDLAQLAAKPTVLIVEVNEAQIEKLRPVYNLLFNSVLSALVEAADREPDGRLQRPVSIIADEFASAIGRIPDLPVRLNTIRSRRISFVAAVQSLGQIRQVYGDGADAVMAAFNTRVFFPALELQDALYASALSGITTVENRGYTTFLPPEGSGMTPTVSGSWSVSPIGRPLLLPGEISQPPVHFALGAPATFFLADTPPFQAWLTPSYRLPEVVQALRLIAAGKPVVRALRKKALTYKSRAVSPKTATLPNTGARPGISETRGWSEERVRDRLEGVKKDAIEWEKTNGSARKWWLAFENENKTKPALVLRLAEELAVRKATITEFFLAYVYSNTNNIQANLSFLDYTRLKRAEEDRARTERSEPPQSDARDGVDPKLLDPPASEGEGDPSG